MSLNMSQPPTPTPSSNSEHVSGSESLGHWPWEGKEPAGRAWGQERFYFCRAYQLVSCVFLLASGAPEAVSASLSQTQ